MINPAMPAPTRSHPNRVDEAARLDDNFAALYAEHSPRVRRVILAELRYGDTANVDDLLQDVWLTLWRYLLRGERIDRPAGLLVTMARRRVVDHYRLARVRRETVADTGDWQFANRNLTSGTSGVCQLVNTGFRTARIGGAQ